MLNPNSQNLTSQSLLYIRLLRSGSAELKQLLLEYKKFSFKAKLEVVDYLRNGGILNPFFVPLVDQFKTLPYQVQTDVLDVFAFLSDMQNAEEHILPPPPISNVSSTLPFAPPPPRFLPLPPPGFLPWSPPPGFPPLPPPGFQQLPPSTAQRYSPQAAPQALPTSKLNHSLSTKIMKPTISKAPLRLLENNPHILLFFKDCKHAGSLPAELFIQLIDLFQTTGHFNYVIFKQECQEQSWTLPGLFFQILDGSIHATFNPNYTRILSEVLYTFLRNHSQKIITVLPTILRASRLAAGSAAGLDGSLQSKIKETLKSFYKNLKEDIFISLILRSKKLRETAVSLKFDSTKYPNGILSTTEEEFAPLRLREEELLYKHLNRFLMTFLNEMLYTGFLVQNRHDWAIHQALKIKIINKIP